MKYSHLFTKTKKESPADESSKNAQLLIRAGYIYKVMAGVYAYTPLGIRVIENIKRIVREEMNKVQGQELIMTNLQPREVWETTSRWNDDVVDIWFKTKLKDNTEVGLAWSHEEAIIDMMKQYVESYKDLPISVYQFQTKLRNELRAKSGIMRGREFVMKDMYSMCIDSDQHDDYYNSVIEAYKKVYDRLGIGKDTYMTFASGGAFTKFSHEFQTICEAGEDVIYVHEGKNIAVNEEVLDDKNLASLGIKREELKEVKSAEVGNIFNFGTQKSEDMDFSFLNEAGEKQYVHLGSYGIGITRVMGVIVEKSNDERGIIWPEAVAPFQVHLVGLDLTDEEVKKQAEKVYETLVDQAIEVLYDDRTDVTAGTKFADYDLIGVPYRLVVSKKSGDEVEIKKRAEKEANLVSLKQFISTLSR